MQTFGEYMNNETASAMKARDYKDATDLVAEKKSHWDGSAVHPTLSQALKSSGGIGFSNQEIFSQGGSGLVQAIPIHDQATRNAGKRGDKQDGKGNGLGVGKPGDPCPTLTKGDKHAVLYENHPNDSRVTGPHEVAPACVSRFGTGGGNVPLVQEAVAFPIDTQNMTEGHASGGKGFGMAGDPSFTLSKGHSHAVAFEPGIAAREGNQSRFVEEMSPTLRKDMGDNQVAVAVDTYNQTIQDKAVPIRSTASDICHTGGVIDQRQRMAVRRLTPKECERLQGFPDNHTLIPWRGKPADQCPDGPRYKALGNSMAVPCMAWIGKRIAHVVALSTTNKPKEK